MSKVDDLIREGTAEIGYLEKSREAYNKYGKECLYPKTKYAGSDNLTKFAIEAGHPNGQAWCQTFIAALLVRVFGREEANRLLCGKLASASTMEVKQAMCEAGRRVDLREAKPGDLAYRSRSGGGHVGLVIDRNGSNLTTIEGNSSDSNIMEWNGGAVVKHENAPWMWVVRPDYASENWHWIQDDGIWYYQDEHGHNSYGWKTIKETVSDAKHWYYFNDKGQLLTGIQAIGDRLYYLYEYAPLEGACCKTDQSGALSPWYL